jgi:hypothetical protein
MLNFRSAPKTQILYMTIQWTFLPSLVQICFVVSEKKMKMWNSLHGCQAHNEFWLVEIIKPSCQKVLSQLNYNIVGMIIEWSCTKLVNRLLIGNSRWPPWLVHNIYKLKKHVLLRHQSYLIVFMGNKNLRFWQIMPI